MRSLIFESRDGSGSSQTWGLSLSKNSGPHEELPGILVGRDIELQQLQSIFSRLSEGSGAVAFLEGEAGIGKSRLLEETVGWARKSGFRVYLGRCEELEQTKTFGPLVEAFGAWPSSNEPDQAAIGRLLFPEPGLGVQAQPGVQYRVVEAFIDLLEKLAADRPVVLALEDLHWCDPYSIVALRAFQRRLSRLPVGLLATLRTFPRNHELETLFQMAIDDGADLISISPLSESDVSRLAAQWLGVPPGPKLNELLNGAAGNPLFVTELLKALIQENAIESEDSRAEVRGSMLPPTLRLTILRRLSSLASQTIELLRLGSVFGTSFSVSELTALTRRIPIDLYPSIKEAIDAGLLIENEAQLSFRHDLLREIVYGDLPSSVRAGLHRDVARMLASEGAPPTRVATHFALGGTRGDQEAIEWLERAAQRIRGTAPDIASDLLTKVLDLMTPSDPKRDVISAQLASQLIWAGRVREGAGIAEGILKGSHDSRMEGILRLTLGRALMILGHPAEAIDVCEGGGESSGLEHRERVQLLADASFARLANADLAGAELAGRKALDMEDSDNVLVALAALSQVSMFRGDLSRAVELAARVVDGLLTADDALARLPGHYFLSLSLLHSDRFDEMGRTIEEGRKAAENQGNIWTLPLAEWVSGLREYSLGDWDDAAAFMEAGLSLASDIRIGHGTSYAHSLLAMIAAQRGDHLSSKTHLEAALREPSLVWFREWTHVARALLQESRGDTRESLEWFEKAWEECIRLELISQLPALGPRLVTLYLESGDEASARDVSKRLDEAESTMLTDSATGASLLARGLVENDSGSLKDAAEAFRKSPRVVERARAFEDAGLQLGVFGEPDGPDLLREAIEIFETVGAQPLAARATAKLRSLGFQTGKRGRRGRPATGWGALTPTESEVVKLVAQGLTNKQVGGRLFISARTVETHVTHAFQKLGFSTRTELVAEAIRRGI